MNINLAALNRLIPELFAPWVQSLGLVAISQIDDVLLFRLPRSRQLQRGGGKGGGVVCGQALAAASDTASVLGLSFRGGRFRACTTTSLSIQFMRPLGAESDTLLSVSVLSSGRSMAVTRVDFRNEDSAVVGASASCSFMYLED